MAPIPARCAGRSLPLKRLVKAGKYFFGVAAAVVALQWYIVPAGETPAVFFSADAPLSRGKTNKQGYHRHLAEAEADDGHSGCGGHHTYTKKLDGTLAFLFCAFLLCTALDHMNLLVPHSCQLPISVVMFIAGKIVGVIFLDGLKNAHGSGLDLLIGGMQSAAAVDPHALLYIILPPLLYESASSMSWFVLRKILPSAVLLAVPGVIMNTLLTGCFVRVAVHVDDAAPNWSTSFLLSAILSATDPVAVVASLAALNAPHKLSALVEGESLLNDGSAVVCAYVFMEMAMNHDAPDSMKNCSGDDKVGCIFAYFCQVALGGCLIGVVAGLMADCWIKWARFRRSVPLELGILLIAVYGTFFVAEAMKTSGVLAVVTLGIFTTAQIKAHLSHDARHAHHVVFSQIGYACNQVTFMAAGLISARFMWTDRDCNHSAFTFMAWVELVGLYIFCHVTRAGVVLAFQPFLKRWGYGITWKECIILVYGGLRGAVGLVVALIVEHNEHIDAHVRQMIAFHTSGIVLLTLLVNGSTVSYIYKKLNLYPLNPFSVQHALKVFKKMEGELQAAQLASLAQDWFFMKCEFDQVLKCVPNFSHIEFDATGQPQPFGIQEVHDCLVGMENDATRFAKGCHCAKDVDTTWQEQKAASRQHFMDLIKDTPELNMKKDRMLKLAAVTDKQLKFHPAVGNTSGYYISSRSLEALTGFANGASFDVKLTRSQHVEVIVGLVAKVDEASEIEVDPIPGSLFLGHTSNTIGVNCDTGSLMYDGPTGEGMVDGLHGRVGEGQTVSVVVERRPGREWEIKFSTIMQDGHPSSVTHHFGPFPPGELYPVIEVHATLVKSTAKGSSGSEAGGRPRSGSVNEMCLELAGVAVGTTLALFSQDGERASSVPPPRVSTISHGSTGLRRQGSCDSFSTSPAKKKGYVTLEMSFEVQLATDAESISELLLVLFHTLEQKYSHMHEHGLLSDMALAWLTESVSNALDTAKDEVNCMRASDMVATDASDLELLKAASSRFIRELLSDGTKKSVVGLFEPLVIEYLSLERVVGKASTWRKVPHSWPVLGTWDYHFTRAKVEALWAFVDAHTQVLKESPTLKRFPDLVRGIQRSIEEAKHDIGILSSMHPYTSFYARHVLLLRKLLTTRITKLQKTTNEGWISSCDSDGLNDALWERLGQVDAFFPRSSRAIEDAEDIGMAWEEPTIPSSLQNIMQQRRGNRNDSKVNAWQDLNLKHDSDGHARPVHPEPPRESTSETNMASRLMDSMDGVAIGKARKLSESSARGQVISAAPQLPDEVPSQLG